MFFIFFLFSPRVKLVPDPTSKYIVISGILQSKKFGNMTKPLLYITYYIYIIYIYIYIYIYTYITYITYYTKKENVIERSHFTVGYVKEIE